MVLGTCWVAALLSTETSSRSGGMTEGGGIVGGVGNYAPNMGCDSGSSEPDEGERARLM